MEERIVVKGIHVNIWRGGVGEPLFVLTGWNGIFYANRDMLAALSCYFDVYGIELPGTGQSDAPLRRWSFGDFPALIDSIFHHYGIEQGAVLGHSFGWVTALKFARYFPKRVRYLIVSNGPILSRRKFWGAGTMYAFGFLFFTALIAFPCWVLTKIVPFRSGTIAGFVRRMGAQYPYLTRSKGVMRKILRIAIMDDDTLEDARNVKVPALIVGSEKGGITPLSNSLDLHKALQGSDLIVLPQAPHDFTGIWATKFAEVVAEWAALKHTFLKHTLQS